MTLPLPIRILLWPFSVAYGWVTQFRLLLYDKGVLQRRRLNAPVISVGNLTVGGTGKTPMVLWLAEKFLAEGKSVCILSRGYRGKSGTSDEVELLKRRLGERIIVGVRPDRYEEGRRIETEHAVDVFLLDDGFQHVQLARDVDILMLDGAKKLRDQWLLPAGVLREPISACSRADLIVVSRKHERPDIQARDSHEHHIFYAQTRLLGLRRAGEAGPLSYVNEIGDGPFFAFCGIGNPQAFFDDLKSWHVPVAGQKMYRDHHRYTESERKSLEQSALAAGAKGLVTTEKDEQNLRGQVLSKLPVYVAIIDFVLSSESELNVTLERLLRDRRNAG
jgi:tetraacyldisaccharide 4'-kinase